MWLAEFRISINRDWSIWPSRFEKTRFFAIDSFFPHHAHHVWHIGSTLLRSFHHWCEFLTPTKRLRHWKHCCYFFGGLYCTEAAAFRIAIPIQSINIPPFDISALVDIKKHNDSVSVFFARTKLRPFYESLPIVPRNFVLRSLGESNRIVIGLQEATNLPLLFFRIRSERTWQ